MSKNRPTFYRARFLASIDKKDFVHFSNPGRKNNTLEDFEEFNEDIEKEYGNKD